MGLLFLGSKDIEGLENLIFVSKLIFIISPPPPTRLENQIYGKNLFSLSPLPTRLETQIYGKKNLFPQFISTHMSTSY